MSYSHRDLEIWQLGMNLAEKIYIVTAIFPGEEQFGLTSQMRRAAVSIPSNIAEGWGRGSKANLANFVRIARGSHCELDTLLELARRLGLISNETFNEVDNQMALAGRKMYAFLKSVEGSVVKEQRKPYGAEPEDKELVDAIAALAP